MTLPLVLVIALVLERPAAGQWQSLSFDLTKNDAQAYTTDLSAAAFTPAGLVLAVKPGTQHVLTSTRTFRDEFDFDVQIEVPERSDKGALYVDLVLVNTEQKRRVVGTYRNLSLRPGSDSGELRYLKDGQAMQTRHENHTTDRSVTTGYGKGHMEWLRMHKAQTKVWFLQRLKGEPYHWPAMADYPKTTYFQEDCESFQVGLAIRSPAGAEGATGTVRIMAMRISGPAVLPRDPARRLFLFDFGPVNQELEDDFTPVNQFSTYTSAKGYGWVIPQPEKLWLDEQTVPRLDDSAIAAHGLPPVPAENEGWYQDFLRRAYWLQVNDRKLFYATSHGNDYVEFFQKWLDLKTPLERDFVGLARSYHFGMNHRYQKDVEERRGSLYIDDDLSAEFLVDVPNGRYNLILGVGYSASLFAGGEGAKFNVAVQGKVRKQGLNPYWRRTNQNPIRDVNVTDGRLRLRLFCDVRKAMDTFSNHNIGLGWMLNYLVILPAEDRELMNQWEWKIVKRRGEIIRRVTFVQGGPARTRNEGNFITLNGKPFYFQKVMSNYHPGTTEQYPYYCLTTVLSAKHSIRNSAHFFRPDWERLSYSDDYPWQSIDEMNMAYTWGFRTTLHHEGILSFVPHAATGEGSPTLDARGRTNRYNIQPPLNSALGKEIQKEAYTMMSNQLRLHPANAGHFIYEELWHPDEAGYDDQSLIGYRGWLQQTYGTIARLNAEWGRQYTAFDEVVQPEPHRGDFWDYTPEWVSFRKFRGWAQREMVRSACDLVRGLEPEHFSWGAKGDFGTQSWYPGEFVDMFGWYTPYVAASVSRHFGRAALSGGYLLNCEHAYLDGRKQFDHKPGPRRYLGRDEARDSYNKLLSAVFKGSKGFFSEWYEDGMCHAFHRTRYLQEEAPKFRIRHWTGQLPFFEPEALAGPPVNMDRNALGASAANQLLLRLAPLWLPARPLEPKVLFPTTEASFFLRFFGNPPYADFETVSMRILRATTMPADFMSLPAVADLSRYRLLVLTDTAQSISRRDAARIRQFVKDGGKLILLNGAGFSDDARPRRYRPGPDAVYPLEEFAELGGYRLVASNAWHMPFGTAPVRFVACDLSPALADGTPLAEYEIQCYYEPQPGSRVFLKGVLPKTNKEVALGLVNQAGNVVVAHVPPKEAHDEALRPLARWLRPLLERWQVDDRVTLGGVDDAWDMYAGCLEGDGYTLAAACNFSERETRKVALRVKTMPAGQYAVIHATAPRFEVMKRPDGGLRLRPDPAAWQMKIERWMSAAELAESGIECVVPPLQAQVFLLRPQTDRVWVSLWKPSLSTFAQQPISIAYGTGAGEKDAAEALRTALAALAVKADVVAAGAVPRKKVRHEVRIDPLKSRRGYREDSSAWYLMDVFDNELVDSPNNLIVVGSAGTNALTRLFASAGTFAYDKTLEKISAAYPDAGRGVIGMVEAVNSAIYDLRSESRDAILVGGADQAGMRLAAEELIRLLREHVAAAK